MPFRDYYNQEPVRRFSTIEEFEQDQASRYSEDDFSRQMPLFSPGTGRSIEDDMPRLNSARENLNLQQKLGWGQNENGDIPKDANGHSRMYIMRKNSQGQETLMEYDGHRRRHPSGTLPG